MFVRSSLVGLLVLGLHLGCAAAPPSEESASEEISDGLSGSCVDAVGTTIGWAFTNSQCGCPAGSSKCAYEQRIVRCFTAAGMTTYNCANLPPLKEVTDSANVVWERLNLAGLQGTCTKILQLRECIHNVNTTGVGPNDVPYSGGAMQAHFQGNCTPAESAACNQTQLEDLWFPCSGDRC